MNSKIFPARNLPGSADNWGREVEREIVRREEADSRAKDNFNNSGRATGGQLAVLTSKLDEVYNRATSIIEVPQMSVTGGATAEPYPRTDRVVSFGPTSGNRKALVSLSGIVSSTPNIFAVRMYAYVFFKGEIITSGYTIPNAPTSTPVEWHDNGPIAISGAVQLSDGIPPEFTIRIVRASDAFSPGTSTMTFRNIRLTLSRSGV